MRTRVARGTRWRGRLPPPWIGHLLVFGLLFTLVLAWFFFQTRQAQRAFLDDARSHAGLLTDAVILHARGAMLAEDVTATILTRFLGNSARFVAYLDDISPFNSDELAGFAAESGLTVIRVLRGDVSVQGPDDWVAGEPLDCSRLDQLIRLPRAKTVLYGVHRSSGPGCILVGLDSQRTDELESAVGLPKALDAVARLPGVVSLRLLGEPRRGAERSAVYSSPKVSIQPLPSGQVVARASGEVDGATLILDLDAGPLLAIRERLWVEFLGFIVVLALAGSLGTWVLYRHQQAHERQLLDYERKLSRQREEAGLGRAAAGVAHEIRNPLNAMAMGLQRLQFEADELKEEHRHLVDLVLQAIGRANGAVTGLLDFARPIHPKPVLTRLDGLVTDQLDLYRQRLDALGVGLELQIESGLWASFDPDLIGRVLDNLIRNALEALETTPGGRLLVQLSREGSAARLSIANDGLTLEAAQVERILEPWFTTKPSGTGLGMAISGRILSAHGARLSLRVPNPGRLCVAFSLPLEPSGKVEDT